MEQTFYSIRDLYISHHGVKGQKWGVRRYRNPDGTLTEEGKRQYERVKTKYTNKRGEFSTKGDAVKDILRTVGGLGVGSIAVYSSRGSLASVAAAAGINTALTVKTITSQVQRRKARKFAVETGMISRSKAWNDRVASGAISGLGLSPLGAAVGAGIGVARGGTKELNKRLPKRK